MPRLVEIAKEVLGETVSNLLNTENFHSVDDFLLNYEAIKEANQHTIGDQVSFGNWNETATTKYSTNYVDHVFGHLENN